MGASSIDAEVKPMGKHLHEVRLDALHYQYLRVVTPEEIWQKDMALSTSPHVELLKLLSSMGHPEKWSWPQIMLTRYARERIRRAEIGMKQWTEEHLRKHIAKRYNIYWSMKKHGFKPQFYKDCPVRILKQPFWLTRFGDAPEWVEGMEIWDGGGRCAAAYVLGWQSIPALLVEDVRPGSGDPGGFKQKLRDVQGVWDN